MPITPQEGMEMLRRLERNKARNAPEPPPEDAVTSESPLHRDVEDWCNSQHPLVPYVHSRMDKKTRNKKGVPDYIFAYRGKTYWLELKKVDGKLSAEQQEFALLLKLQGVILCVARSKSEFLNIVKQ